MQSIKGMVALVTGGATGLGRAVVERLLRDGARGVISIDRQQHPIGNNNLHQHLGDVTEEVDVQQALELARSHYGGQLNLVVNCAGHNQLQRAYDFRRKRPHDLATFADMVKVNLVGTFNVTRLAVGLIGQEAEAGRPAGGVVINTASVAAFEGQTGQVAAAACSGGIVGMTLPLARDLAPQGIRCVTIVTGLFDTPSLDILPETVRANLAATVVCPKRLGRPEEFAHLVVSIVENEMLNGEVIRLDGALRQQP